MKKLLKGLVLLNLVLLFGNVSKAEDVSAFNATITASQVDAVPGESVELVAEIVSNQQIEETYTYSFYVIRDEQTILLNEGTDNCYSWKPYTPATYEVYVEVSDSLGNMAIAHMPFEVKQTRVKAVIDVVDPVAAVEKNGTVTIQASAENGIGAELYEFYVLRDGRKIVLKDYSTENTAVWKPYTSADYIIGVGVKDVRGNVISQEIPYTVKESSLNLTEFDMSENEVCVKGTGIELNAQATGGVGEYQYAYYVMRGTEKIVLQDYSASSTYVWYPYTMADYVVYANVKDEYGNTSTLSKNLRINASDLKIETFNMSVEKSSVAESPIQITANGEKGEGDYKYLFYVIRDGKKIILQSSSKKNTYTWSPYTAGDYEVWVEICDASGSIVRARKSLRIEPLPFVVEDFQVGSEGIVYGGEEIFINPKISGGVKTYQSQYYVIRNGQEEIMLKDFSEVIPYTWKPYTPAHYEFVSIFRDAWGVEVIKRQELEVLPPSLDIEEFNVANRNMAQQNQDISLSVKIKKKGNPGTLQYRYYVIRDGREIVLRDWSTQDTAKWRPVTPADYVVGVDIKDANDNIYHSEKQFTVIPQHLFVSNFTINPSGSVVVGNKVTLQASGRGGTGKYQYKFYVVRDGREIVLKDFSNSQSVVWNPVTPANYTVKVVIRDEEGLEITSGQSFVVKKRAYSTRMGVFSTVSTNDYNGTYNMTKALLSFNQIIIQPGETMSFFGVAGPCSAAQGYLPAGIVGGVGYGGGICQASTTLYGAALKGGLTIVERRNHSVPSTYVPIGQDAMVNYGTSDLKIRNDHSFPVKLVTYVNGNTLYAEVWGEDPRWYDSVTIFSWWTGPNTAIAYRDYLKNGQVVKSEQLPGSYYW